MPPVYTPFRLMTAVIISPKSSNLTSHMSCICECTCTRTAD